MNKTMKHWLIVACCCGLAASSVGVVVNTVGVFYAPVSKSLGVLRGTFALSATCTMIAIALISLIVPMLLKHL